MPLVGALATALGAIPVDGPAAARTCRSSRGGGARGGELVSLLPQGTIRGGGVLLDPVLKGRTGAARLAAMTGAPVVIGLWGTEEVWPRRTRARMLNLRPADGAGAGRAARRSQAASAAADTRRIMDAISGCYLTRGRGRWRVGRGGRSPRSRPVADRSAGRIGV